ncbi:hypothetical protein CYMTET_22491 [Cymbomonas tetramitiformis]|uniref:Phospholipid/glycerol acyltransferase domain-containing protein n=1 Tax=Cymbomonas tetramitiformis TaxID=36881 RepID=A0AAE0G0N5_9CHLO|nr:hypothetical protein CYMTET_22491 [Cymbomonas tetramitiformis]
MAGTRVFETASTVPNALARNAVDCTRQRVKLRQVVQKQRLKGVITGLSTKVAFQKKTRRVPYHALRRPVFVTSEAVSPPPADREVQQHDEQDADGPGLLQKSLHTDISAIEPSVEGGGGAGVPPGSGGGDEGGDGSNGGGNGEENDSQGNKVLLTLHDAWKRSNFLQKFFFGGLFANTLLSLTPSVHREPFIQGPPPGEELSPFVDYYALAGIPPLEKLRKLIFAPLAVWRGTLVTGVVMSYFLGLNACFLVVRDRGARYKLAVPVTKYYFCGLGGWIMGCRSKVVGLQNLQDVVASGQGFVTVANHVGYYDFLALGRILGPCCVVAKAGLQKIPLMAPFADCLGAIYVDRGTSKAGKTQVIIDRAKLRGDSQRPLAPLLIFPEGTTSSGAAVINFKSGAFAAGVPVLPVALKYSTASGLSPAWIAPVSSWQILLCMLCEVSINLDITVLPAHKPTPQEVKEPRKFAKAVQKELAACLGVPVMDHLTYKEGWATWARYRGEVKGQT